MAQIDHTEEISFSVGQNYEVGVVRIAVPIDSPSSQRHEPLDLFVLFGCICHMQVQMKARMALGRRHAPLQSDLQAASLRGDEHVRPPSEAVTTSLVPERFPPKDRRSFDIINPKSKNTDSEHPLILPDPTHPTKRGRDIDKVGY